MVSIDIDAESGTSEIEKEESFHIPLVLTLSSANLLNTLTVQSSMIILPSIARDLDIPAARQQWIISSYYIAYGCFLLLWGRLADIYGRRTTFILGSAWVTASTIAVPFAPNEIAFDILRAMQGFGGAANVSSGLGILGGTFGPGKPKDYAFSIYGAGHSLGTILGILLGGVIGQYLSWKWIFWIFGILAGGVAVAGVLVIPSHAAADRIAAARKGGVDWLGGALITTSLLLLTFTLTEAEVDGWERPWIPPVLSASVVIGVLFVCWQVYLELRTTRAPLLKMSIWLNTRFTAAQVVLALFQGSFNNFLLFATYYYQDFLSKSVISTTLYFLPTGIVGLAASFLAAKAMSRIRSDALLTFCTSCLAVSCLLYALPIPPAAPYWSAGFVAMCLAALGSDLLAPVLTLFTALSLPPEDQALGGGICNSIVQIGRVVALVVATAIQTAVVKQGDGGPGGAGLLSSLHAAQYFNFALALSSAVLVAYAFRGGQKVGTAGK
ncbi:putative puromycin resistance protein pur8 protein [Neofusicoccum parvum]|nr:putative puromycin resistance protein pur8 protein [Neofusicoccum parvum]